MHLADEHDREMTKGCLGKGQDDLGAQHSPVDMNSQHDPFKGKDTLSSPEFVSRKSPRKPVEG